MNEIQKLAKGDLMSKLTSEEFLKMIIEEFKKLTKQNPQQFVYLLFHEIGVTVILFLLPIAFTIPISWFKFASP